MAQPTENTKVTFRVADGPVDDYDHGRVWSVYDSNGWCRGMARTKADAQRMRDEFEAGTLHGTILYPPFWP